MRRTAKLLGVHRITVARKLKYLAQTLPNKEKWDKGVVQNVQFDDLITLEHTKCKPLAVSMAVESKTRKILGLEVSTIPASGYLANISRQKSKTARCCYLFSEDIEKKLDFLRWIFSEIFGSERCESE